MSASTSWRASFRFPSGLIHFETSEEPAFEAVTRAYGAFLTPENAPADLVLSARRDRRQPSIHDQQTDSAPPARLADLEAVPRFERELQSHLFERLRANLFLHAAAVTHGSGAILLPAASGRGKTTLAAILVESGCSYLTDDLVILDRQNRILPFPKALSLKARSLPVFERLRPRTTAGTAVVWHVDPESLRAGCIARRPAAVGWVFLPEYQAGAATEIEPLTAGRIALALVENSVHLRRHREAGLDRLLAIARRARGWRVRFGDAQEAGAAIRERVESSARP
jgi:hypothetical protein